MKYVQYIETDGSEIAFPLTNAVISSIDCQIHFEYVPLNGTVHYDAFYTFLFGLNNKITFRTNGSGYKVNNPYQIIFGNAGSFVGGTAPSFQVGTKYSCILDKYGINVNGTQYNFTSPATSIPNLNCVFNGEYNGTRIIRCPLARYISLKVVLNGNDICNYKAAVDDNNVPCFYDEVSQTYAYKIGSGTPTAGPDIVTDTNLVPINKYKLYTSNIQKTYNGSTQINKMYVGNDLVYRALPTTTPPHPIFIDYVYTTTESFVNTSIVPTTSTKFRVKFKTTGLNGGVTIGYGPNTPISAGDSQDYRLFHHRGMNDFTFDFNSSRFYGYGTTDENGMYDLTCGNNYIYDNVAGATAGTGTTQSSIAANNVPIYIDLTNRHGQIHQVTIYGDNDTVVFDGHATEFNGVYGIYDTVSGQLLQPTDSSTVYGGTWQ